MLTQWLLHCRTTDEAGVEDVEVRPLSMQHFQEVLKAFVPSLVNSQMHRYASCFMA